MSALAVAGTLAAVACALFAAFASFSAANQWGEWAKAPARWRAIRSHALACALLDTFAACAAWALAFGAYSLIGA